MASPVIVIGVAGPSASGKSTLCHALVSELGEECCTVISMDSYYRDLSGLSPEARARVDFDRPAALELELLVEHIRALRHGKAVSVPVYDFTAHTRMALRSTIEPARVVIVEGLFALCHPDLREQLDLAVFVEAPDTECLRRRIERDVATRGRTAEEVIDRYDAFVRPSAEQCVLPSRALADVNLNGTSPVEGLVAQVLARLPHAHAAAA